VSWNKSLRCWLPVAVHGNSLKARKLTDFTLIVSEEDLSDKKQMRIKSMNHAIFW
jgi:hypothetical protein